MDLVVDSELLQPNQAVKTVFVHCTWYRRCLWTPHIIFNQIHDVEFLALFEHFAWFPNNVRCCGGGAARGGYSYLWWFKLRQHPCAKWSGVVGLRLAARERRATVQSLPLLTHCIRRHATVAAAAAVKPPLLRHRRALCSE